MIIIIILAFVDQYNNCLLLDLNFYFYIIPVQRKRILKKEILKDILFNLT